jgi:serine/threonine protein kinase
VAPGSPGSSVGDDSYTADDEFGAPCHKLEDKYKISPHVLGKGHHGSVRLCKNRVTGQNYAVKSIEKKNPTVKALGVEREIKLLQEMGYHDSVISLIDVYDDEHYVHIVTDLCEGGELFDKIVEKATSSPETEDFNGCFSERQAARILHQILSAVASMHSRNIAHRDIKPENILFETKDEDSPVKIIDFGLARKHHYNPNHHSTYERVTRKNQAPMRTVVGTPYYIAPEVLRQRYTKSCDLWSIGVISYVLLCGYPPFNGNSNKQVYEAVTRGQYWYPSREWQGVSFDAKDFIDRLLQVDPRNRMTAEEALSHPWIVQHNSKDQSTLSSNIFEDSRDDIIACPTTLTSVPSLTMCVTMDVEVVLEEITQKDSILCCASSDFNLIMSQ